MLTTPMILLGILAAMVFFYLLARLGGPSRPEHQQPYHPASPPPGYPSNPVFYQPSPAVEEEPPVSGVAYWPIFLLVVAVAVFYLGNRYTLTQAETSSIQKTTDDSWLDNSFSDYEYEEPQDNRYYRPEEPQDNIYYRSEEPKTGYTVPLPSPSTKRGAWENQPAEPYSDYPEAQPLEPVPVEYDKVLDYRQGYGVQLFATEKGWWEEAHIRQIQESYPNFLLLIGTSYTSGNMNKFILGSFDSKTTAGQLARQIGKVFPGAYVVDLSELEQVDRYWTVP